MVGILIVTFKRVYNMYICKICGKVFNTKNGLSVHVVKYHKVSKEDYYLLDHTKNNKCLLCGNDTHFKNMYEGYFTYCSLYCARHSTIVMAKREQTCLTKYGTTNVYASDYGKSEIVNTLKEHYNVTHPSNSKELMQKAKDSQFSKIKQYCVDNNLTYIQDLISLYGSGWYKAQIVPLIKYNGVLLVDTKDIPIIVNYYETSKSSKGQIELLTYIKSIYDKPVKVNYYLDGYDLDLYLPDKQIAFEYNGIYWHSTKWHSNPNYHLDKTKLCESHNIKLIHIFENEWPSNEIKQLIQNILNNSYIKRGETITLELTRDSLLDYDNYTVISSTEPKPHNHNGLITYDCGTVTIKMKI